VAKRGDPSRFIASAIGFKAYQMGYRVAYFSMSKLLQRLQMAKADDSKNWPKSKKRTCLF